MSLHALAGHMATKGRGGDSMLVHMTPGEVQALQALATRHGGTLTINPETGQPEANFLKKILPMVAGFALGPAGFGLMSAGMAGAAVGGITALSTGSLSRGLMAGMGAYGGASLGAGLMGSGIGAAQEAAMAGVGEGASQAALNEAAAKATTDFMGKGLVDRFTEGAGAVFNDPKGFVQGMGGMGKLAQTGLAAISPIMADEGVQTTTPKQDTGNVRRFSFDRFGQTYTPQGVFPAAGYTGMAQGGIVALAEGGGLTLPEGWGTAGGKYDDPKEKIAYFNQNNITPEQLLAANQGVTQTDIDWMKTQGYAGNAIAPGSNQYVQNVQNWFESNPAATYQDIQGAIGQYGLNPEDVKTAMQNAGLSGAAQFAAFNQNIGDTGNVTETYGGLKGLSSNINYWLDTHPGASLNEFKNEMGKWELDNADILRATGKTPEQLLTGKITEVYNPADGASGSTGAGVVGGGTVVNPNGTITTSPRIPGIPVGGFTGMTDVRNAYTQGGGSLGYVNKAPENMAEFNTRFNKQTGDSLAAYNYLMGKGANPVKSGVGEIARPYSEATLGIPAAAGRPTQKFIYENGRYVENPNYVPVSYDSTGKRATGLSRAEVLKGLQGLKDPTDDVATFDWMTANNVTVAQLAEALNIPFAEAQKRYDAAKVRKTSTAANTPGTSLSNAYTGDAGGTGPSDGPGPGPGPGPGNDGGAAPGAGQGTAAGTGDTIATGGLVPRRMALGGLGALAGGGSASQYNLGGYSDGGRLLRGPGDGVSDSIPATIGDKQPARLADGEFVVPARIVSELGNGSTEAGARKLYAMMDRVQKARGKTTGKSRVAANTRADKYLPA